MSATDALAAIRADDALLNTLGGRDGDMAGALADDELCALLLALRLHSDARPVGVLVDTPRAVAVAVVAGVSYRPSLRARLRRFLNHLIRRTR